MTSVLTMPRGVGTPFHYRRNFVAFSVSLSPSTPYLSALNFGSNTWPIAFSAMIAANYDLYRINHVKVSFIPYFNVNATNATGGDDQLPQIAWVINYDDTASPGSYDLVMAQTGSRFTRFNRTVSVTVQPRALGAVAASGGNTNGFLIGPGAWFNAGGSAVLFLGLKFAITGVSAVAGAGRFDINYELDITCLQNLV